MRQKMGIKREGGGGVHKKGWDEEPDAVESKPRANGRPVGLYWERCHTI